MLWTYELCIRCYSLLHLWKQTPNEQCSFIYQNVLLLSTDKCAFLSNAINMCTCYFTLWLSNRLPYLPKKIFMHSVHHTIIFITKTVCASEAVYTVFMFIIILHYWHVIIFTPIVHIGMKNNYFLNLMVGGKSGCIVLFDTVMMHYSSWDRQRGHNFLTSYWLRSIASQFYFWW